MCASKPLWSQIAGAKQPKSTATGETKEHEPETKNSPWSLQREFPVVGSKQPKSLTSAETKEHKPTEEIAILNRRLEEADSFCEVLGNDFTAFKAKAWLAICAASDREDLLEQENHCLRTELAWVQKQLRKLTLSTSVP
jgi:hypothetical protein